MVLVKQELKAEGENPASQDIQDLGGSLEIVVVRASLVQKEAEVIGEEQEILVQ